MREETKALGEKLDKAYQRVAQEVDAYKEMSFEDDPMGHQEQFLKIALLCDSGDGKSLRSHMHKIETDFFSDFRFLDKYVLDVFTDAEKISDKFAEDVYGKLEKAGIKIQTPADFDGGYVIYDSNFDADDPALPNIAFGVDESEQRLPDDAPYDFYKEMPRLAEEYDLGLTKGIYHEVKAGIDRGLEVRREAEEYENALEESSLLSPSAPNV